MKTTGKLFLIFILLLFLGCKNENPIVVFESTAGFIGIELYIDQAPVTCYNFLNYVKKDKLNGGEFYRVVTLKNQPDNEFKIEVLQGGMGWCDTLTRFSPIVHESTEKTKILHKAGIVSMARNEPGTASSEFFICLSDEPELDFGGKRNADGQGFAAFGRVVEGMEIVQKIYEMPDSNQFLIEPVKILSVKVIE
ncbi:MAG: peptidylprolyl isomerase [Salinivirgaceae bacterium]|jgi:peptidyl-prolyl cis-trans isomerase A (cyclophilin A)|nr:peptidylprolyl isomerase [Salinivirgaceae bacterium]